MPQAVQALRLVRSGCIALLLASCAPKVEVDEIRLGLIVQQDTIDGPTAQRAVQLAVRAFNESGGLEMDGRRHPVVLLVEDPRGKPEEAARAALRLINQQGVFALVGPLLSVNAIPVAEVADKACIPVISPTSTHVATTADKPFSFRLSYTDPVQGAGLARFARETLGAGTAGVLYDESDAYSRGLAAAFRDEFESGDPEGDGTGAIALEPYVQDGWEPALKRLRERSPDVLFLPNFEDAVALQAKRARALGFTATLLGGDSWTQDLFSRMPELDGSYQALPWHSSAGKDRKKTFDFLTAYQQTWGEPMPDLVSPVLAYDAAGLLLEALRRVGRPVPEAVRDALADLSDYPGATGDITFRGTSGNPTVPGVVLELRGGQIIFAGRLPVAESGRSG